MSLSFVTKNKKKSGKLIAQAAIVASAMLPVSAVLADTLVLAPTPALAEAAAPMTDEDFAAAQPLQPAPARALASAASDADLECIAKVVLHEAGNQPRDGQLAVAQLIMNRVESGRFADTACGVANQPGQFFNTAAYNPRRDARWDTALEVAREAMDNVGAEVVPGALFYHATYQQAPRFFRTRARVMTLGGHVFYR